MACSVFGGCVSACDGLAGLVAVAGVDGAREPGHGDGCGGARRVAALADALVVAAAGGDFVSVAADCARMAEIRVAVAPHRDAGRGARNRARPGGATGGTGFRAYAQLLERKEHRAIHIPRSVAGSARPRSMAVARSDR